MTNQEGKRRREIVGWPTLCVYGLVTLDIKTNQMQGRPLIIMDIGKKRSNSFSIGIR